MSSRPAERAPAYSFASYSYMGTLPTLICFSVAMTALKFGEAWIFLVGSAAGTFTTVCFLYVIFRFPKFLEYVKAGGAEADVIVRLATFYELNCIRVAFRFIFSLPLLIIALDAIRGPYPIVGNAFATDFLLMMAGIGSFISSGITLLVDHTSPALIHRHEYAESADFSMSYESDAEIAARSQEIGFHVQFWYQVR
ncbi:hypothetical protein H1R20_g5610, partial [Candolleomyces eurysporus]